MNAEERRAYNREVNRRWRARHREEERARHAANRAKDPGGAARLCKSWRERNPKKYKQWRLDNPDAVKLARRVCQHNRRQAKGKLLKRDAEQILDIPCAYCGVAAEHIDHCTPLSRGGRNDTSNCVGACARCNLSKGTKTVLEFTGLWPTG
jgi:5-methylcytosine-specific restriction endonuclease McrA